MLSISSPALDRAKQTCLVRVTEPRGKIEVYLPRGNVCLSVIEGHLSAPMAQRWIDVLDRHVQAGIVFDTFHDWERMSGYESGARQALTSWVLGSIRSFRCVHFLVSNPLAKMGVSAATVAVALVGLRMESHPSRSSFEQVLSRYV